MRTLRLLKVIVQPIFILDDGATLTEQVVQAIVVPAAEWDAYPAKFAADVAALQKQLEAGG